MMIEKHTHHNCKRVLDSMLVEIQRTLFFVYVAGFVNDLLQRSFLCVLTKPYILARFHQ